MVIKQDTTGAENQHIVERVLQIVKPYTLACRDFRTADSIIPIGGSAPGGTKLALIAGLPAVESEEQIEALYERISSARLTAFRSAAFKPPTSPYAFQGPGKRGLEILARVFCRKSIPVITEVLDPHNIELISEYVQIIQVGSNSIQNFDLLREAGRVGKSVILKGGS